MNSKKKTQEKQRMTTKDKLTHIFSAFKQRKTQKKIKKDLKNVDSKAATR